MKSKFIEEFNIPLEDQKYIGSDLDYRCIAFERFDSREICCEVCGKTTEELEEFHKDKTSKGYNFTKTVVVHHKDMRGGKTDKYYHIDNRPENLLVLCPSCHNGLHSNGREISDETRRKLSEAHRGKILSEETKRKLSESMKGNTIWFDRTHSKETRKRMSESKKGEKNPMFGKSHSEESRRKLSESHKAENLSKDTRRKLSEAVKGKKWYNDGSRSYRLDPTDERCRGLSEGMMKRVQ